ncbi:MAG: hypothetical protein ACI85I_000358 [Arenicella sp.]|jgi:hypothetical protein
MEILKITPIGQEGNSYPIFVSFDSKRGVLCIKTISSDNFTDSDIKQLKTGILVYQNKNQRAIKFSGIGSGLIIPKSHLIYYIDDDVYQGGGTSIQLSQFLLPIIEIPDIEIKATTYTPEVKGIMGSGFLKFSGEGYFSYSCAFFIPIFSWLDACLQKQKINVFRLEFWMTYFNTTTSGRFFDVVKMLEKYQSETNNLVEVHWYCEANDVEMQESAEEFNEDSLLNMEIFIVDNLDKHPMNK